MLDRPEVSGRPDVTLDGRVIRVEYGPGAGELDLVRYGKLIERRAAGPAGNHEWRLEEPGVYIVRIHSAIKKGYRQSAPLAYFPDEKSGEYFAFLTQSDLAPTPALPLRAAPASMPDMLLVSWRDAEAANVTKAQRSLCNLSAQWVDLPRIGEWHCAVLAFGSVVTTDRETIIFSGDTVIRDRYIVGPSELPADVTSAELLGGVGPFALLAHDGQRCVASRDFNNYFQQHFYQSGNLMLVSPSYHLLLVAMAAFGVAGKIDETKAAASLLLPGSQLLEQNFSYRMDIEGARQVPVDKDLLLDRDGWHLVDNRLGKMIKRDEPFDEETYRALIVRANSEVRQYMGAVLRHPDLSKFILNLTGGIDSRYLLSLLTGTDLVSRIFIHCYANGSTGMEDVRVATAIADRLDLNFETFPLNNYIRSNEGADLWSRSEFMGRTWKDWISNLWTEESDGRIAFIGGGGESLTRPEYGARCFDRMKGQPETVENVVDYFCEASTQAMIGSEEAYEGLLCILKDELSALAGGSSFERLETHYLSHRHALHFTPLSNRFKNVRQCIPMQSPTLFRLHHMTYERFRSIKLMVDMIEEADPSLLDIPFAHGHYNAAVQELRSIPTEPLAEVDLGRWERAQKERNRVRKTFVENDSGGSASEIISAAREHQRAMLMKNLRELLALCPELERHMGRALYYYIVNDVDVSTVGRLYSKVTSLVDQARVFRS